MDITEQLPRHTSKVYPLREPAHIDTIVIHHTASTAPLVNQAKYHVNTHNWAGIGYHLLVDNNQLLQVNDLLTESNHTKGHNPHTIGICINADLSKRSITDYERELLAVLIITVKSLFNIKKIVGHNELVATSCPCTSVPAILDKVKFIEMGIDRDNSFDKQLEIASRMANQLIWLSNLAHGKDEKGKEVSEDHRKWALQQLMLLEQPFRKWGWLK